jgi:hypothetical protein
VHTILLEYLQSTADGKYLNSVWTNLYNGDERGSEGREGREMSMNSMVLWFVVTTAW